MRALLFVLGTISIGAGVAMGYSAITDIRHSRIRRNKNAK
jgi:hypothetical protein